MPAYVIIFIMPAFLVLTFIVLAIVMLAIAMPLFYVFGSVASYRCACHRRAMLSPFKLVLTSLRSHRGLAC
jgi:hypothetical protein